MTDVVHSVSDAGKASSSVKVYFHIKSIPIGHSAWVTYRNQEAHLGI